MPDLPHIASGARANAQDLLAAIRTLQLIEREQRPATAAERRLLARFPGFGPVALRLFPDPITGAYKDGAWQALGEALQSLLTPEEYASARRATFTAFYTAPVVMQAMHDALARVGLPGDATVLEPGCGIGNFMGCAPVGMRFIGVELDRMSGRIARALYPEHDIRLEHFRDTSLPRGCIDAVLGNVPFADVKLAYQGDHLALHDYFLAKSLDALKPGGVMAVVTSHYTLDKQHPELRARLAEEADFLGAIRLPSDAFTRQGTSVVTDLLFLRKRVPGETPRHVDLAWLETAPLAIDGVDVPINRYFLRHPEMVLGIWSRKDRLYDGTYSLASNGSLADQLGDAVRRLPMGVYSAAPDSDAGQLEHACRPQPLPALERHVTEGSFFVADDQTIMQVQAGQAVSVTHGERVLRADGTLMGRRLAALIDLRDQARRVLRSQHEDWPEAQRHQARHELNRAYDRFVSQYGPINTTTRRTTEDGTVVRRLPNLVTFRDDPDAMLVMSLEAYDEDTDTARKADIMQRDVVGRVPPVTEVGSAEDGLLASLNQRGRVDLPYIASLYHAPEAQIIAELSDPATSPGQALIYRDPATGDWQTADQYLSGNVRAKLQAAEAAGETRNAEALRKVQPEDVLPGDMDANLGAPWIPDIDIRDFAASLFNTQPEAFTVGHLMKDALWTVTGDGSAQASVPVTTDYGTPRINGLALLEQALNLKSPTIYDVIHHPDGSEERKVNQDETLAARDKQRTIKEAFKQWVFQDPDRTERLVRLYNDTYNNLRLRAFDGAHLTFPGMNPQITLYPHQKDAVWRVMSGGNTLLAHAVGAGKTNVMAAAGMKMKQAGLSRRALYAVPNHMLEQFGRECLHLYPNARLLIAGKEDFTRDRRKLLTAKIASGDWDGIVMTHSSFERIGMSPAYQAEFLREQIADYEALLTDAERAAQESGDRGQRHILKTLEKQKQRREERLRDLLAADKKDDGLVFDELGVDHLFIDESQYFKNLEAATKMDRVAGIQTGGSERAFDLYLKCCALDRQHPGHGVTFATGTPISNTMVELYTLQRYLDARGLAERGLEHFDAWAATFGEVVDAMEISPDGRTLRPRSRFARFVNLPELQQMFRAFADVKTAEMLNLPKPDLKGGKPCVVACLMSEAQRAIQDGLVRRYEAIRAGKVKPWDDNALAVTTDGRKLALDARLLSGLAHDCPGSKINALVANVAAIWDRTAPTRGTQLIFSDLGVHPTPWGYSVYQDVINTLVNAGLPREQIASIGDADTDARKQALFDKVRSGQVRVLLGSTQKMGTGTNVQQRLAALHHLDAPWKPAEVEQRDGRILRQGNGNEEVEIYRYVTTGSFDAYMWQALETKATFIGQVMTGDLTVRQAEDIGGQELSYAEVKAIASGNPAVLILAEADAEITRLQVLKKHHADEQYVARKRLKELPADIARLEARRDALSFDIATAQAHAHDTVTIGERRYAREEALDALGERLHAMPASVIEARSYPLGVTRGLTFSLDLHPHDAPAVRVQGAATRFLELSREHRGPRAVLNAVDRLIGSDDAERERTRRDLALAQGQLRDYQARIGRGFAQGAYLEELTALRCQLESALSERLTEGLPPTEALVQRFTALRQAHTVDAAPERTSERRAASLEEAVTTRILRGRERQERPYTADDLGVVGATPLGPPVVPATTADVGLINVPMPQPRRSTPSHRRRVAADERQLRLW
jgi:N12 class adenine-specific DNA methylase